MSHSQHLMSRWATSLTLAASLMFSSLPASWGQVNQTIDGHDIPAGTYDNTAGNRTTFTNSSGTGMLLKAGDTVVGREVLNGLPTGNGGHIFIDARGQMVQLDGNIDVSGLMKNGAYVGNGGMVTVNSAFLFQNGQIFANGLNGGMVQMNVGSMSMGPDSRIEARGLQGAGGVVSINAATAFNMSRGAVIDTSGAVIGSYNTNVIEIKGGLVNLDGILLANGLNPGQQGGKIQISAANSDVNLGANAVLSANGGAGANGGVVLLGLATDPVTGQLVRNTNNVRNDGVVTANGGDGASGDSPTPGGNGGTVTVGANTDVENSGLLAANGGHGGSNTNTATGGVYPAYEGNRQVFLDDHGNRVYKETDAQGNVTYTNADNQVLQHVDEQCLTPVMVQFSQGQDGARGGDGGTINVTFGGQITQTGKMEVRGGNGGDGQAAASTDTIVGPHDQIAHGGNGGDGGNGGMVNFVGIPSPSVVERIDVSGGHGGQGGSAVTASSCGCATPGAGGACGAPGSITMVPFPPAPPPVTPPSTPPTEVSPVVSSHSPSPTLLAPYPKEYPLLGAALPPVNTQVLNYNRSIFLARSPLPVIQKKTPVVPPPAPAKVLLVKPKPKPAQKKVPVRGYW